MPDGSIDLNPSEQPEVEAIARASMTAIAPATGATPLQQMLIRAVAKAMAGVDVDTANVEPLDPAGLAQRAESSTRRLRARDVRPGDVGLLPGSRLRVPGRPYADQPVDAVRAELGIPEKSAEAMAAGSVGPFHTDGMSAFQQAAGARRAGNRADN